VTVVESYAQGDRGQLLSYAQGDRGQLLSYAQGERSSASRLCR
jgi:hypothetical protein